MDLKAVGLRIKTAREAKGLTQENLAALEMCIRDSPHTSFEVIVRKCFNGVCHVENQCGNSSTNHVLSVFCIASMTIDIDSLYYFVPVTQDIYLNHNLN